MKNKSYWKIAFSNQTRFKYHSNNEKEEYVKKKKKANLDEANV